MLKVNSQLAELKQRISCQFGVLHHHRLSNLEPQPRRIESCLPQGVFYLLNKISLRQLFSGEVDTHRERFSAQCRLPRA